MDRRLTWQQPAADDRWTGYFFKTTNINSYFHQVDEKSSII